MDEIDLVRQLVELAVTAGRSHQSAQTGFVHYCHHKMDEGVNHTIPTYENCLFALALIRMQTVANIQEGLALIEKLLPFQDRETGNFPVYLHEYPQCRDRYHAVHLLPPIYWVLKGFQKVMVQSVSEAISKAAKRAMAHLDSAIDEGPFQIAIKAAAAKTAFARLWKDEKSEREGLDSLDALLRRSQEPDFGTWFSPVYIAETLVALQMVYDKISESPWSEFWTKLSETWCQKARTYVGPPVKALQWRSEPQPTLYDLYLGDFTGGYPYHSFIDHPFQLQGALVRTVDDTLPPISYPQTFTGVVADSRWLIHQEETHAYTVIETAAPLPPELKKGFHYFRLVWGDENRIHSLSCQGGAITSFEMKPADGGLDLLVWLAEDPGEIERNHSSELRFFVDQHEALDLLVQGKKANTFHFHDTVSISSGLVHTTLSFHLEEGDARIMGHIQPGNRISQVDLKGENRFNAYDWEIFLRTVRRYTPCLIRVKVRISDSCSSSFFS